MLADRLIGRSDAMKILDREVKRAALHPNTVLIRGETGVGKELVARALHEDSPWSDGPFIALNCASLRGELFESQLFGHRKGAFTGATIDRDGAFVQADGGTLFLDEIGQLEPNLQARLLRVLEDGLVQPLGSDKHVAVSVRVIAATNDDLDAMVQEGEFREDLLYRLRIVDIEVPPLRAHLDDLPDLVEYYLAKLEKLHNTTLRLTPQALHRLQQHTWPGNVRELVNTLRSAAAQVDSSLIDVGDIRLKGEARTSSLPTLALKDLERLAYEEAARRTAQNPVEMAKLLGVSRTTVYGKLREYGWAVDKQVPE
jgi:DNA-binding NtrC family response regulator